MCMSEGERWEVMWRGQHIYTAHYWILASFSRLSAAVFARKCRSEATLRVKFIWNDRVGSGKLVNMDGWFRSQGEIGGRSGMQAT